MTDPDPHAYIDLARLGRTGFWAGLRGIIRIILYMLVLMALAIAAAWCDPRVLSVIMQVAQGNAGPLVEFAVILPQVIVVLWAVHDATVRTQRRAFGTLISPDGRIDIRRILFGGLAALGAILVSGFVVSAISGLLGFGKETEEVFKWHAPDTKWLIAAVIGVVIIPLQAGGEELLFRGWLTQTLGQGIRNRGALALLVGVLFALVHTPDSIAGIAYFTILSIGFSAVSLRDGRLELAIGAHITQNLFVLLIAAPFLEGGEPTLLGNRQETIGLVALATGALQSVLLYALVSLRTSRLHRNHRDAAP